ncbi:sodium/hydrogen exchanger 8-like isoform X1 [Varroa jacobsoni]|uniref:sodium/hydrogen exchanger 8-like isoform X1 n=1 Tax=Varroa jacobsoni TaxID=62625 RepID=UPI000BF984EB|nr:sodium/hydrogen exchanger 8-like isoform X1 [Varroa jacobsoni]XP_022708100.1 sodium/hydrogen exchanger 8-like isoform X1 [Varroa jacobsoni]XP_022708101.1 sodium/hydrogen exchanger 8-like isoform X1 [Varroa jacobsoni]
MFGRSSISSIGGASAGALTASPAGRGNSGSTIAELWGRLERFHKMGLFVEYKVAGVTLAALLLILMLGSYYTMSSIGVGGVSTTESLSNAISLADGNSSKSGGLSTAIIPAIPPRTTADEEVLSSLTIFFVLTVIAVCILSIHFLIQWDFRFLPESVAVVLIGASIGLFLRVVSGCSGADGWQQEEAFSPTTFFLVLLPPIIYESGYNLHKGNFFHNIGSILIFAILGTAVSAMVIGAGVYILGVADLVYSLSFAESLAFGSLISAVDPVATLAIFAALDVDPVLNMLVFGESILNDAVSIVLATTVLEAGSPHMMEMTAGEVALYVVRRFLVVFFGSAVIGALFALAAALLLKYVDLRRHPSIEFGIMLVFIYAPYGLAEGIHLSGIMAILFNGVVMSHYTHFNLSSVTQITMQQTLRTLSLMAETSVFAYLGLAIFSHRLSIQPGLVIAGLALCLAGRAANIYPLSGLLNHFREHRITNKMQFIMWFSGLRGAVAYALAMHLNFGSETRHVIVTTTLLIVLLTIVVIGGSTMPMMRYLERTERLGARTRARKITLSKTKEMGQAIDAEHLSEMTEEELEVGFRSGSGVTRLRGFARLDVKYLTPFFTRRFTPQDVYDGAKQMSALTDQWYRTVRPSDTESTTDERSTTESV